jgi:hypothetical protein
MSQDCCSPNNKKQKTKKGPDSFLIGIVVVTLLILGGAVYFGSKMGATTQISADSQVSMVVAENRHDWGTIDINSGIVSKSFPIENKGSAPLKLSDVKTSCMCTTAQLKTAGQTSKKFGMHEKNSSVFEVKPGETVELLVEYDPAFHGPSGTGPISRTITMNSNDESNPTLSFQLAANVVKQ